MQDMTAIPRAIGKGYQKLRVLNAHSTFRSIFAEVNSNAIFVLGNQKSVTTAIVTLLAAYAGLSSTLDISTWIVEEQDLLHMGSLSFEDFVRNHRYEFSNELITEPALIFLYEHLRRVFPSSKVVFIVGDSRDSIRSTLNRVNRRGDELTLENFNTLPKAWQCLIDSRRMDLEHEHYVDSLAARWNCAVDVYLLHSSEMVLARYEDFVADKVGMIERLAAVLGLEMVNDISGKADFQYRPRGDSSIPWREFLGSKNLAGIQQICSERMAKQGYIRSDTRDA
jgi:hypothetical protein